MGNGPLFSQGDASMMPPGGPGGGPPGLSSDPAGHPARAPVNPFVQGFMLGMQAGIQQAKGELGGGPPPMGMFGSGAGEPSAPAGPDPSMISPFLQR